MASLLSAIPGPAGSGEGNRAAKSRADGRADGRNFVLCLKSTDIEVFEPRQIVQNIAGGRDGIRAVEQGFFREFGCRDEAHRNGFVAGHFAISSGLKPCRTHAVAYLEGLSSFAEEIARLQGLEVGLGDVRMFAKFLFDPVLRHVQRAIINPEDQSQREKVLAAINFLVGEAFNGLQRGAIERRKSAR